MHDIKRKINLSKQVSSLTKKKKKRTGNKVFVLLPSCRVKLIPYINNNREVAVKLQIEVSLLYFQMLIYCVISILCDFNKTVCSNPT